MRKNEQESIWFNSECKENADYWPKCHEGRWSRFQDQVTRILKKLGLQEIQFLTLFLSLLVSHPPSLLGCKRRCFCTPRCLSLPSPGSYTVEGSWEKNPRLASQAGMGMTQARQAPAQADRGRNQPRWALTPPFLGRLPGSGSGALAHSGPFRVWTPELGKLCFAEAS